MRIEFAQSLGFPQINIDLIAGMLGETEENWQRCVEKTIELAPDSVTIYQMELPFNTTISSDVLKGTGPLSRSTSRAGRPSAAGSTKRSRRCRRPGYTIGSAYTAVRDPERTKFIYRDRLWQGADLAGSRRGVVRPHQRRAHAEPRHVGDIQREDPRRVRFR